MPSESPAKDAVPPANPSAEPATWQVDEARHREAAQHFDRWLQAWASRFSAGLSPVSLALASTEWALRLWSHPAESTWLALRAPQLAADVLARTAQGDGPGREDARFAHPAWQGWPWSAMALSQQAAQAWWREATALHGMDHHHRDMVGFFARQWLDALSPSNVGPLNPEVMEHTFKERGANLGRGAANAVDNWRRRHALAPLQQAAHAWRPGQDLAITPGKVVYRNELVELIQYLPLTSTVHAEPVFIVPSWIMKYYILDLQPHNSLVRWLVAQGHTVFILSWRNPDESDAGRGMADYLQLGVFYSLAAIARLLPGVAVHACGYCLGGTLLSLAAAALARPARVEQADTLAPLASVSLLAAETDFSEPGEMGVLIDEPQVELLESMMAERGFLTGPQMAGSFAYLHARDQVWARRLREFWLGESQETNDLMAWNADVTRMPAAMHSEYLRRCYLHNQIAEGRFPVQGRPVSPRRHPPALVRGGHRDRPCVAVEVGLQDPPADRRGIDLRADQRRPQRRHRQRTRPRAPPLRAATAASRRCLDRPRSLGRGRPAFRGLLVDGLARLVAEARQWQDAQGTPTGGQPGAGRCAWPLCAPALRRSLI